MDNFRILARKIALVTVALCAGQPIAIAQAPASGKTWFDIYEYIYTQIYAYI